MNEVMFSPGAYIVLDFADEICLLAELLSLMDDEAAAIGLEVNWDRMKVQTLGTHQPDQEVLDVHGHQVAVIGKFVYLGALAHFSVHGSYKFTVTAPLR